MGKDVESGFGHQEFLDTESILRTITRFASVILIEKPKTNRTRVLLQLRSVTFTDATSIERKFASAFSTDQGSGPRRCSARHPVDDMKSLFSPVASGSERYQVHSHGRNDEPVPLLTPLRSLSHTSGKSIERQHDTNLQMRKPRCVDNTGV